MRLTDILRQKAFDEGKYKRDSKGRFAPKTGGGQSTSSKAIADRLGQSGWKTRVHPNGQVSGASKQHRISVLVTPGKKKTTYRYEDGQSQYTTNRVISPGGAVGILKKRRMGGGLGSPF